MKKFTFSCDLLQKMADEYLSGKSFGDICVKVGCSKSTIRVALMAYGVKPDAGRSISKKRTGVTSPRKGTKVSLATKLKMSNSFTGRTPWNKGIPHSEETKIKMKARWLRRKELLLTGLSAPPSRQLMVKRAPLHISKNNESIRQSSKRFLRRVLKYTGKRKNMPLSTYLGYSTKELIDHLGVRRKGDHIDHIVPIFEFIKRGISDPAIINALPNLRYLNGHLNQVKSASVPENASEKISECIEFAQARKRRLTIAGKGTGYVDGILPINSYTEVKP